jgi:hypothetical protein
MGEPEVDGTVGVADHEAEVMPVRFLHAEHLLIQGFVPFLLREGRQITESFRHEILVHETGGRWRSISRRRCMDTPLRWVER